MRKALYLWFERNRWAGDLILAGGLFVVMAAEIGTPQELLSLEGVRYGVAALTCAVVLIRRTFTPLALCVGVPVMLLNLAAWDTANTGIALVPVLVHAAVVYSPGRSWGWVALVCGLTGAVVAPLHWWGTQDVTLIQVGIALCAAVVVAAFVIGERQRERTEFVAEQVRTLTERNRLLAAERDQRALVAAADERTRIARELHDIVAHSLSVIVVQADGGAAAVARRPELAAQVLTTIGETSREALREMRGLVGVLRAGGGSGTEGGRPDSSAQYAPAPGMSDLATLVESVRQAGVTVDLIVTGSALPVTAAPVTAGVDLTVYRVVQEALTNVLKHAGPSATATVTVTRSGGQIDVSVCDDGRGAAVEPDGLGNGLLGMRERVGLHGGTVHAGPLPGGGFGVRARIPEGGAPADASGRMTT